MGDLTHDSIGLATEVFPLNIGLVGAYIKKQYGDAVDIKLFKYIPALENAIYDNPPDVLALSNYPWCHNIDLAMFRLLERRKPEALKILGGPNFPHLPELQSEFLAARPMVDGYAYLEGEIPFSNFLKFVFETGDLKKVRPRMKEEAIPGLSQIGIEGKLLKAPTPLRMAQMEDIPSPYLTGLLDPFFDGRLSPLIQTNRGCPFTCTYCADGTRLVNKINHFTVERVKAELNYIAERVPRNIKALFISDLNFGMYARDSEITQAIDTIRRKYNYPQYIDCTTGKNSRERVISNVEKLSGTMSVSMSVQTMTPVVLKNIKRDNMRLDDFIGLKSTLKKAGLDTVAEVILALPGETRESHLKSLEDLFESEIDHVFSYTLMLLNGSELNTPVEREKWGYKTKFRVIPRDFTALRDGEKVVEVEEVVIETNTLSFEDYVFCRKFVMLLVVSNNIGFRPLTRFILQNKLSLKELLLNVLGKVDAIAKGDRSDKTNPLAFFLSEFERETREELWDTEAEIIEFFQDPSNYQGLLEGRYGANLMQTYKARIWAHAFENLADLCFSELREICKARGMSQEKLEELREIEIFCRARTYNLLGEDRMNTIPEAELRWDFLKWVEDPTFQTLDKFKFDEPKACQFVLSDRQYELIEEALNQFGRNDLGKGKLLIRVAPNNLWRSPKGIESARKTPGFYSVPISNQVRN